MPDDRDHHARDRGQKVRLSEDIRRDINSDHPCCIPVGDAVGLLHELDQMKKSELEFRKLLDLERDKTFLLMKAFLGIQGIIEAVYEEP